MKERLSIAEYAGLLHELSAQYAQRALGRLVDEEDAIFADANRATLAHELKIVCFWVIDAFFLDEGQELTNLLHACHFKSLGLTREDMEIADAELQNIIERYKAFYEAYDEKADSQQFVLGSVVAQYLTGSDKPVLDARKIMMAAAEVPIFYKTAHDIAQDVVVIPRSAKS